jgi:hypothetical protein
MYHEYKTRLANVLLPPSKPKADKLNHAARWDSMISTERLKLRY